MLSEIDDLEAAAEIAAKVAFADAPASVQSEAVVRLERVRNMVDAAEANALSAFDASKEWMVEGHKSVGAWLKWIARLPAETGRRRAKHARALRHMPLVSEALAAGAIGSEHVDRLARAWRAPIAEKFAETEATLVDAAANLAYFEFCRVVTYFELVADPDHFDRQGRRVDQKRSLHLSELLDGEGRLDGWLTPICRAIFGAELERLEKRLFEADWAEARSRLGEKATKDDLRRTAAERRHDAAQEMAQRSASLDGEATGPRWTLNLLMDWATYCAELARMAGATPDQAPYPDEMTCEMADGTIIPPSLLLTVALGGDVRRMVIGAQGEVLDFGRRKRLFTGPLREAILLRDRRCSHVSCDVSAGRCEVDHIEPWSHRGPTSERNARAECDFHNRWEWGRRC